MIMTHSKNLCFHAFRIAILKFKKREGDLSFEAIFIHLFTEVDDFNTKM